MTTRIVITGMGIVTPYGIGPAALWSGLLAGQSAVRAITAFDASHVRCRAGGQLLDFQAERYVNQRIVRKVDRFSLFGLVAGQQALEDAGVTSEDLKHPVGADATLVEQLATGQDHVGITVGNNLGGWEFAERELYHLWQQGPRAVSPYMATAWFPAAVQGNISIQFGIKGIGRTFLGERTASAYAIIHAAHCLQQELVDLMLAGGVEAPFSPYAVLCYETSGLMSAQAAEHPGTAYRPFDRNHDGLVAGEGGAFLVLERATDALRRGARIYAELAGWAATQDGYNCTRPAPDGRRYADAMTLAMRRAGITSEQVDAIFAAGSAVPVEDETEVRAVRLAFGRRAERVPVSAPKAAFGNLFGAATAVDVVLALLALKHGVIPATLNLDQPAPECDLDYVAWQPRGLPGLHTVAVNARGIGGTNACLILRRWPVSEGRGG
jgi:3-oxoacyl-(acyl-carrier-protein) synthase